MGRAISAGMARERKVWARWRAGNESACCTRRQRSHRRVKGMDGPPPRHRACDRGYRVRAASGRANTPRRTSLSSSPSAPANARRRTWHNRHRAYLYRIVSSRSSAAEGGTDEFECWGQIGAPQQSASQEMSSPRLRSRLPRYQMLCPSEFVSTSLEEDWDKLTRDSRRRNRLGS